MKTEAVQLHLPEQHVMESKQMGDTQSKRKGRSGISWNGTVQIMLGTKVHKYLLAHSIMCCGQARLVHQLQTSKLVHVPKNQQQVKQLLPEHQYIVS